jgi:hypothetical protein
MMTQHVDGDDYTWENGDTSKAGGVLYPAGPGVVAAFAELREQFGAAFDAIPDVDAWVKAQRSGEPEPGTADAWAERWQRCAPGRDLELPAELAAEGWEMRPAVLTYRPDLRTADQRERDDVAELGLRCDNLVDALAALAGRVAALEARLAGVRLP